jgi:hypothetical protein
LVCDDKRQGVLKPKTRTTSLTANQGSGTEEERRHKAHSTSGRAGYRGSVGWNFVRQYLSAAGNTRCQRVDAYVEHLEEFASGCRLAMALATIDEKSNLLGSKGSAPYPSLHGGFAQQKAQLLSVIGV